MFLIIYEYSSYFVTDKLKPHEALKLKKNFTIVFNIPNKKLVTKDVSSLPFEKDNLVKKDSDINIFQWLCEPGKFELYFHKIDKENFRVLIFILFYFISDFL